MFGHSDAHKALHVPAEPNRFSVKIIGIICDIDFEQSEVPILINCGYIVAALLKMNSTL